FPVTTLPVPAEVTGADVSVDELSRCPAVALFVERAAAANSRFVLTEANAATVAAICRRLEGLRLALGLAAVRTRALSAGGLVRHELQPSGEPRFSMLDTIREYALDRLRAAGEADALCRRHAALFLSLAEHAEPQLVGSEQAGWFDRLEAEHDNIRAALHSS